MNKILCRLSRLLGLCSILAIMVSIDVMALDIENSKDLTPSGPSCSNNNKVSKKQAAVIKIIETESGTDEFILPQKPSTTEPTNENQREIAVSKQVTYYVSTAGNDASTGIQENPWRTIQKAATTARAGETVVVLPGLYNEVVNLENNGSRSKPIRFIGYGAIIDGTGFTAKSTVTIKNKSYIEIEGFEIQNSDDMGIGVFSTPGQTCSNIKIHNNKIHDVLKSGIWIEGNQTNPSYSYIIGNTVSNTGLGGIVLWNNFAGYYLIDGNEVFNWQGTNNFDGIQVGDSPYTVVRNNTVHDGGYAHVASDFIDVGGEGSLPVSNTHHHLVEDNLVYHTNPGPTHTGAMKFNNRPTYAIMRHNKAYGVQLAFYEQPHKNCTVYRNTVVNTASHPLQFWNNLIPGVTYQGIAVENNIFGFGFGLFHGQSLMDGSPTSILMNNNMYRSSSRWFWTTDTIDGSYDVHLSDTEYQRWRTETGQEPTNTGVHTTLPIEKIFTEATQLDFSPAAGSPAINNASAITTTLGSGNGTILPVKNSDYFYDGYDGLTDGDLIQIGSGSIARIIEINETTHEITLDRTINWNHAEPVNLAGRTKNIGAI